MTVRTEDRNFQWGQIIRAKCIDTVDLNKQARIKVWIPDLMPEIEETQGIWARPANNPLGGRNLTENSEDHYYQGSCYIPPIGSWLYVFFENGDPSEPRYMGALDIATTDGGLTEPSVVAECRQGPEYWKKWVPIRTKMGRCIVVSDDVYDERVEITGKKREISTPPNGDDMTVYQIDFNQTSILLDEREGKEKVLIRTHHGDYLHIDIDERMLQGYFKNDIRLQTDADFHLNAAGNINLECQGDFKTSCGNDRHVNVGNNQQHGIKGSDFTVVGKNKNLSVQGATNSRHMGETWIGVDNLMLWVNKAINAYVQGNVNCDAAQIWLNSDIAKPLLATLVEAMVSVWHKDYAGASPPPTLVPSGWRDT